jgi:hypothetical protein
MVRKKKLTLENINKKVDEMWDLCSQFEDTTHTKDNLMMMFMKVQTRINRNQYTINKIHNIWVFVIVILTFINMVMLIL